MSLSTCPVCAAAAPAPFFELAAVPVYCNVLWPTRDDALAAARGDVRLVLCDTCGLVWNSAFDAASIEYGVEYENSLHYSPLFRAYVAELADRLVREHGLVGAHVVDVGCGKGDFLALLCAGGRNRGTGFDPSYDGGNDAPWLDYRRELFEGDPLGADLVSARHVLEHVTQPVAFAEQLRLALRDGGTLYLEVPSGEYMLRRGAVWDVIYEHCTYFTEPALERLLHDAGFDVVACGSSFGEQYLWAEATPAAARRSTARTARLPELERLAAQFAASFDAALSGASRMLDDADDRSAVALWGAGSKGVTFLNVADVHRRVAAVVDVNPRKQGRHVPGTGQRILAPEELATADPETVLVMNPLYSREIEELVRSSGLGAEVVVV